MTSLVISLFLCQVLIIGKGIKPIRTSWHKLLQHDEKGNVHVNIS